jgi:TIR domain
MPSEARFDVFLSYNSVDRPWVTQLKAALQAKGLGVWLDDDQIRPGDIFGKALEEGIRSSNTVALIVSPEALASAWVEEEYYRALSLANSQGRRLRMIPVLLRTAALPGFLSSRTWVDFRDPSAFETSLEKLCWGITGNKPSLSNGRAEDAEPSHAPLPVASEPPPRWRSLGAVVVVAALCTFFLRLWLGTADAAGKVPLSASETITLFAVVFSLLYGVRTAIRKFPSTPRGRDASQ